MKANEIKRRIEGIDLEPIKFKLSKLEGYSIDEINVVEKWYRRFLFLAWRHPSSAVVVPEPIDAMWHHHILDTKKYADDCSRVFGDFLHHFPYFGLRGDEDARALRAAFKRTSALMDEEFGENAADALAKLRKEWAADESASSCSDCSGIWPAATGSLPHGELRPRLNADA